MSDALNDAGNWRRCLERARLLRRPDDVLVLADEPPSPGQRLDALLMAAQALIAAGQPGFALTVLARAEAIEPGNAGGARADALAAARSWAGGGIDALPSRLGEPERVILFSGHMIDRADRKVPRFPPAKAAAVAAAIDARIAETGAGPGDIAIAQAASGGDLLFGKACLDRGAALHLHLPQAEPEFRRHSVSFAGALWLRLYREVTAHERTTMRIMPDRLGPAPEGEDVYGRCNRWMLYSALVHGPERVAFIALWDGATGDGPGGTEHMVRMMREYGGREPAIIDSATL